MTYEEITKKFLIQYDKEPVTSSYPSLTKTEIAHILDKSYLTIIAQKLTGRNQDRVVFEGDLKAVEDIRPLITTIDVDEDKNAVVATVDNEIIYNIPDDMLYYLQCSMYLTNEVSSIYDDFQKTETRLVPTQIIKHSDAQKFEVTPYNTPWIKIPVVYLESDKIHLLYDMFKYKVGDNNRLSVTYIKKPISFVSALDNQNVTQFELSDTVAEELINQSLITALDMIESSRLQSKLNINQIDA